MHIIVSI